MSNRNLELNLRARADTRDLERLSGELDNLISAMRKLSGAVGDARDDARALAGAYGQLSEEEARSVEAASRLARSVSEAATARERAAAAAQQSAAAESRAVAAQQQQEQAAIRTAIANERLAQSQSSTAVSVSKAAVAEEKLAQERQKTLQATSRTEKEELAVARAREQVRASTAQADAAEARLARTRASKGSGGLATQIVSKGLAAAGGVLAAQQVGQALLDFGKDSLMAASMAEESAAKFKTVFKDAAAGVEADLGRMAEANRRSVYDLMGFAATLQDTFVPLGFARDQAADLSTQVTQLALDLAAFNNQSDSETVERLTSALVGNHEAVRTYGVVLTETVLKAELARMGADKLTGAALEQAKAQARLNIILRSTSDAQGAALREAGSFANTLKAWDAAVLDLKVSIGAGLLPVMTDLANVAIEVVNAITGKGAEQALANWGNELKSAVSPDEIAAVLAGIRGEIIETGGLLERSRAKLFGNIGDADDIRPILAAMAQASGSADEFAAALERADLAAVGSMYFGQGSNGLALTAEQFYEATRRAQQLEVASKRTADELARMQKYGKVDIEVEVEAEVDTGNIVVARDAIGQLGSAAEQALGSYYTSLTNVNAGVIANYEAVKALKEAWLDSFTTAPVDDVISAQQELDDLLGRRAAGEIIPQADIDAARQAIVEANRAISDSYKQRALDALMSQAIEKGNFEAVAGFAQVAVAMGLMTQQEADLRTAFANTVAEVDKLTGSLDGLSTSAQGSAIAGLAAGVYDTAEAARQAAENLDAVRNFWANGPQGDIGSFYQGLTSDTRQNEIEINIRIAQDEQAKAEYELFLDDLGQLSAEAYTALVDAQLGPSTDDAKELKGTLEEYDRATYEAIVAAAFGNTKADVDDLRTRLINLTKDTWVVKIEQQTTSTSTNSGGGGGSNPDPEEDGRGRTFVVEGVTVNNYSGGPGVADQTRRGVLAAFRSLA